MAYVRTRTSKGGTVSTALIESYRDSQGQSRQRLLANLHGEPDTLRALAKLAVQRQRLRKDKDRLADELAESAKWLATNGVALSAADPVKFLDLKEMRTKWAAQLAAIETKLSAIESEGAVIKKHCTATPDKIQTAISEYKKRDHDAECLVLGLELGHRQAKAKLRRSRR